MEPPAFGANGAGYAFAYIEDDEWWYGDLAVWRQGEVVAILIESLDPDVSACSYTWTQYLKVAATFR